MTDGRPGGRRWQLALQPLARRVWLRSGLATAVGLTFATRTQALPAMPLPTADPLASRAARLARAEAALAQGDAARAKRLYEAAANAEHASDIEQGIVRSLMQAGDYRRATAFAAHTAGAHGREVGGSVLYAWLLALAGQLPFALKVLDEASGRGPDIDGAALLDLARRHLLNGQSPDDASLLALPHRVAPHAWGEASADNAVVVAAGLLLEGGRRALIPTAAAVGDGPLWLRNGLGQTVVARPPQHLAEAESALVTLDTPLPVERLPSWVGRDAFAGAPLLVMDYPRRDVTGAGLTPAWPRLRQGFLGMPRAAGQPWPLGVELERGHGGGPVFDLSGRLVGVSASPTGAGNWLVQASSLRSVAGVVPVSSAVSGPVRARLPFDDIYETAMRITLDVLRGA